MLGLVLASHNYSKRFNIIMLPNFSEGLFVIEAKTIAEFFYCIYRSSNITDSIKQNMKHCVVYHINVKVYWHWVLSPCIICELVCNNFNTGHSDKHKSFGVKKKNASKKKSQLMTFFRFQDSMTAAKNAPPCQKYFFDRQITVIDLIDPLKSKRQVECSNVCG